MKVCFMGGCGHFYTAAGAAASVVGLCPSGADSDAFVRFERSLPAHVRRYAGYEAMLDNAKPDLVVVDGLFGDHAAHAAGALARGIHVFCEKPLAVTLRQLDALKAAHARSGARLCAMLTARFDPWFYTLKALVGQGVIGPIRLINAQKSYVFGARPDFFRDPARFGSLFAWVGIHSVDLILWLTGRRLAGHRYAHSGRNNFGFGPMDDSALAILELDGGILAGVTVDYLRPRGAATHGDDRIRVVGADGILEVMDGSVVLLKDGRKAVIPNQAAPRDIYRDFVDSLEGRTPGMISDADSLAATEAVLRITQAD